MGWDRFDDGLYDEVENDYEWHCLYDDPNYEPEPCVTMSEEEAVEDWFKNHPDVTVITKHDDGNLYDNRGRFVYGF
nr:MAG TPA: hypothetical protein [Caudoviricetes sp.]